MRFFSLAVSYSQLVQFSLETAHNSVRKAIADLCNVSPLRVVDLHVSKQNVASLYPVGPHCIQTTMC